MSTEAEELHRIISASAKRQAVDRLDDAPEATVRNPAATENTKGATA
jgi:hypothetical protein